jgi:pilus assembly protein FimV
MPDMDSTLTLPEPVVESAALDFDIGGASAGKQAEYQGDATVVGLDFNLPEAAAAETSASVPPQPEAALGADLDFDIGFDSTPAPAVVEQAPVAEVASADMLDVGSVNDHDLEFDVSLTESTVLGQPMRDPSFDMSSINLDLAEAPAQPVSAPPAPALDDAGSAAFEVAQMSTVVNSDFSEAQLETMVNPQFGSDMDLAPEFDISPNEEVATKLDLAKAYEEMGDLEGARELLQEVLKEGDATQQEKAQAILTKIAV